jgi:hypothetical protein
VSQFEFLFSMTPENHVKRDNKKECSKYASEQFGIDLNRCHRANRSAKEKPQREQTGDREINVSRLIVSEEQLIDRWEAIERPMTCPALDAGESENVDQ